MIHGSFCLTSVTKSGFWYQTSTSSLPWHLLKGMWDFLEFYNARIPGSQWFDSRFSSIRPFQSTRGSSYHTPSQVMNKSYPPWIPIFNSRCHYAALTVHVGSQLVIYCSRNSGSLQHWKGKLEGFSTCPKQTWKQSMKFLPICFSNFDLIRSNS